MNKIIASILVAAAVLTALTLLTKPHNEICCAFAANRYFGWPGTFLVLHKTTDDLNEAKKVLTLSNSELMRQGWELDWGYDLESWSFNASTSFLVDSLISLMLGSAAVAGYSSLKKYALKRKSPADAGPSA
ncbi:MAG: hypothetical protein WC641_05610 [Patescibacteria group bacterium]